MKPRKHHLLGVVALAIILLAGWSLVPADTSRAGGTAFERRSSITNPAADHCESKGHTFVIRATEGSERGYCQLTDGTERDLWEWYYEQS